MKEGPADGLMNKEGIAIDIFSSSITKEKANPFFF